jgi:hypothetical protein
MLDKYSKISLKMLVFMGIFLPLAETVRRSNQLLDPREFLSWFDDYILGAVLLFAADGLRRNIPKARLYAIAAFGIGFGALFLSTLAQFRDYAKGDPGILPSGLVALFKILILVYMGIGLHFSIQSADRRD